MTTPGTALSATAWLRVTGPIVLATFRATVRKHGPPASTLTDNGMVFTTRLSGGKGGRNGFEHELRRRGITQKNGRPNHPQTQGKIARGWMRASPERPPPRPRRRRPPAATGLARRAPPRERQPCLAWPWCCVAGVYPSLPKVRVRRSQLGWFWAWNVPSAAAKAPVPPSMMPSKLAGGWPVAGQRKVQTGELLATYTDDQLAVIDDFLTRARQLTAAYASTLSGHHATASRKER